MDDPPATTSSTASCTAPTFSTAPAVIAPTFSTAPPITPAFSTSVANAPVRQRLLQLLEHLRLLLQRPVREIFYSSSSFISNFVCFSSSYLSSDQTSTPPADLSAISSASRAHTSRATSAPRTSPPAPAPSVLLPVFFEHHRLFLLEFLEHHRLLLLEFLEHLRLLLQTTGPGKSSTPSASRAHTDSRATRLQ